MLHGRYFIIQPFLLIMLRTNNGIIKSWKYYVCNRMTDILCHDKKVSTKIKTTINLHICNEYVTFA